MEQQEAPKKNTRGKQWFLTENNPTEESIRRYKEVDAEYILVCKEHQDDDRRTPHIHIILCFKGRRYWSSLKKLFPRADIEQIGGSIKDCKTYCTKEDPNPFEKGEIPLTKGQVTKKKWEEAYQAAKEGRFDDIPRDMYICHDRAFHRIYEENKRDPSMKDLGDKDLKERFLWLWGPTGTGKSHMAREIAEKLSPGEEPYLKKLNKWWNGYSCQKVTIIEEADPERCKLLAGFFKEWADKWNMSAEVKNGHFPSMRPQYIIVTSNYNIEECFPEFRDHDPIKRRFTEHELKFRGEPFTWPKEIAESDQTNPIGMGRSLPGNIIEVGCDLSPTRLEPKAKRQKVDDDVNETGLIDPPAILENTPEDFNSDEIN